ncbi:MAG: hypothetical protein PHP97_03235 [Candidatus Shapirobacteria bacterium]|nr:hypothetical protein [Candidatus Shapirobacteria bacterium]MDD3002328.1 hypothetical protein [Candidatus Shapirobacteria bacterium]MDD4382667.1 hypothetical protein [Candidatus Shapirobacteria bacterium]
MKKCLKHILYFGILSLILAFNVAPVAEGYRCGCSRCSYNNECERVAFCSDDDYCQSPDTSSAVYSTDNSCTDLCDSGECRYGSCYTCVPDCSCADNIYVGDSCWNGCDDYCDGRKCRPDCSCADNIYPNESCWNGCDDYCTGTKEYYSCPSKCSSTYGCQRTSDYLSYSSDCSQPVESSLSYSDDCNCPMTGNDDSHCYSRWMYALLNSAYACREYDITNCKGCASGNDYNCYLSQSGCTNENDDCVKGPTTEGQSYGFDEGTDCTYHSASQPYCTASCNTADGWDGSACATDGSQYTIEINDGRCYIKDDKCDNTALCYKCGNCIGTCDGLGSGYTKKPESGSTCSWSSYEIEANCVDRNAGFSGCYPYTCCKCKKADPCSCNTTTAAGLCKSSGFTEPEQVGVCRPNTTCEGTKLPDCGNTNNYCDNVPYASSNGCGTCYGTKLPECGDRGDYCDGVPYASSNECGTCTGTKPVLYASCTGGSCSGPSCGQTDGSSCTGGNNCGSISCTGCDASCGTSDAGDPTKTTIKTPNGTPSAPSVYTDVTNIDLSWNKSTDPKADYYNIGVWHDEGGTLGIRDKDVDITNINDTTIISNNLTKGVVYRWGVNVKNNTCVGIGINPIYESGWSSTLGYFIVDAPPFANGLVLANVSTGLIVPSELGDKNQVCDTGFDIGSTKRKVRFIVTATDSDGTISNVQLKLGDVYTKSSPTTLITAGVGETAVATFDIDFNTAGVSLGTYPIYTIVTDNYNISSNILDTGRSIKIWDCGVSINGTFYDSTDTSGATCSTSTNGIGFDNPADQYILNLTDFSFFDTNNSVNVSMSVSSPNYSSGSNKLIWGSIYQNFVFNNGFTMSHPTLRFKDQSASNWQCINALYTSEANAYDSNPTLKADFSGILIQDPWWQASGGGVISNNKVVGGIPATCTNNCQISIGGLVAAPTLNNKGASSYQNWYYSDALAKLADYNTNYDYFYSQYFVKKGVGTTLAGKTINNISDLGSDTNNTYFVDGDLIINGDILKGINKFLMIIAKGNITVNQTVNTVDGILVANKINVGGSSPDQLIFNGSLYAADSVNFFRDHDTNNRINNNSTPTVVVNYNPELIFNMPSDIAKVLTNWQWGN